ncbi:MAG: hypothetical protein K2Y20_12170, partial [Sphingomonas sp.]|nr:hypothetical protein [Sphingomonas sp.]
VDTNSVQNGTENGVYIVDNRVSNGSSNEGSTNLGTNVTQGSVIQWNVFNIDPTSADVPQLTAISNASVWGASGQPQVQGDGSFIGQAQATGSAGYQITFNVQSSGGSGVTVNVSPSMSVH